MNVAAEIFMQGLFHVRFGPLIESLALYDLDGNQIRTAIDDLKPLNELALSIHHEEPTPEIWGNHPPVFGDEDLSRTPQKIFDDLERAAAATTRWRRTPQIT